MSREDARFWKSLSRADTARLLTIATMYHARFGRRVFEQVSLSKVPDFIPMPWAEKYHLDVCAIETQRHSSDKPFRIDGYEIKSCRSDFTSDTKWKNYLGRTDTLTFIAPPGVIKPEEIKEFGVGLWEPCFTGFQHEPIHFARPLWSKYFEVSNEARFDVMYGIALSNERAAKGYRAEYGKEIIRLFEKGQIDAPQSPTSYADAPVE